MKKKFLLPILSVCMVVALVSVGFAAWLITGNHTEDAQGQFVTYDVSNQYFKVTVTPTGAGANENKIVFGKPEYNSTTPDPYAVENPWFKFEGSMEKESLSVTFTITIDADVDFVEGTFTPATVLGTNKIKLKLTETPKESVASTTYDKLDTAKKTGYVTAPSFIVNSTAKTAAGSTMAAGYTIELQASDFAIGADKNATATVKVTFAWGTAFDGNNPYEHYNGLPGNDANRKAAQTAMEELHKLNNTTYYVIPSVEA